MSTEKTTTAAAAAATRRDESTSDFKQRIAKTIRRGQISNVRAEYHWLAEEKFHTFDRISVGWEKDGARFHVWLNPDGSIQDDKIYKNPPLGIKTYDPGYFRTKTLSASAQVNRETLAEVMPVIDLPAAKDKYIAKEARKQSEHEKARRDAEAKERLEKAAPELLRQLKWLLAQAEEMGCNCATTEQENTGHNRDCPANQKNDFFKDVRASIASVEGRTQ